MAEIPVEKKTGGLPWWLIPLLLLLLLIPLLFFLSRGCNDAAVVGNANGNANANRAVAATGNTANTTANGTAVVTNTSNMAIGTTNANTAGNTGTASTGAAVTDAALFGSTADKASLVGRQVNFSNVKVNRVLSDHVFTVTSGSGEMFVYLDEGLDTGGGKEQQIKIRAGQNINVAGDFRRVPTEEVKEEAQKGAKNTGLTAKEYAQMKGQQIYLHTNSVSDAK